jgi:hypothetical protein
LKRGNAYDPELDRQQRVKELRIVYEARMQERESQSEGGKGKERMEDEEDAESEITKTLHTFFLSMSSPRRVIFRLVRICADVP